LRDGDREGGAWFQKDGESEMGNERLEVASESCYDCGGSRREVTSTMIGQLRVFGVHMTRTEGESSQGCGCIEKERTPGRLVPKKNLSLPFPLQQVASADSHNT
jgi:hypothetical protein